MGTLKLLIVDDVEDNRTLLNAICRRMEGFEIAEASDGVEAIEMCEQWHPHIILMDVMMPRMDGYQASKIIKERFPQTIIIVITAAMDSKMEEKMASIGVAAYIHKPVDKNLIRFKLQNFAALLRSREGEFAKLSIKEALNPFSSDIRRFKTIFEISDAESIMDFGNWVLIRHDETLNVPCRRMDIALELFYELMRLGVRQSGSMSIIVEESYEELFVTMRFKQTIDLHPKTEALFHELGENALVEEEVAYVRLTMHSHEKPDITLKGADKPEADKPKPVLIQEVKVEPIVAPSEPAIAKEIKHLETNEKEMLRQSFVRKTSAIEYVQDIGGDVLDEIRDLESLDEEWSEKLHTLESEPSVENIYQFTDNVLGVYVRAINNLFEFTALAYALSSLGSFLKEHADAIIDDPKKLKTLVMLTEHLGSDLASWRDHIFGLQDTADIHYLDSSFFSSCMQIEQIIGNKEVASNDDDDDGMEFF
jgi:CheY-like chemotaxis protein